MALIKTINLKLFGKCENILRRTFGKSLDYYSLSWLIDDMFVDIDEKTDDIRGICCWRKYGDMIEITFFVVTENYRNQKIGTSLMTHVISTLGDNIYSLHVSSRNQNAIKLYEGCGFHIVDLEEFYYSESDDDPVYQGNGRNAYVMKRNKKSASKDVSKDISKDVSKNISKDVSKDISKDVSKDISKDVSDDVSKDVSEGVSKDENIKLL